MAEAYASTSTISRDTIIRKTRTLVVEGDVLVETGKQVEHDTPVATAERLGKLSTVRVAQQLGIEPADIERVMTVAVGDSVDAEQVIAEQKTFFGLITWRCQTPVDGTIELVSSVSGHVGVRQPPERLEVRAYVPGTVVEVLPGHGAVIESRCAQIQGLFGVGGEAAGTLRVIDGSGEPDARDAAGGILALNIAPSANWLRQAAELGAVGVVCPTIDDRELADLLGYEIGVAITGNETRGLTLVLTEGFGQMTVAPRTWDILNELAGRRALINGATQVRAGVIRPELLVPYGAGDAPPPPPKPEAEDGRQRVRLLRAPYFGAVGHIAAAPVELQLIATGARARVFVVRLEDGREVTVPRANVEALT